MDDHIFRIFHSCLTTLHYDVRMRIKKSGKGMSFFTLLVLRATQGPFADRIDQDQTAQNVQSDLGSTHSCQEIRVPQINFKKEMSRYHR